MAGLLWWLSWFAGGSAPVVPTAPYGAGAFTVSAQTGDRVVIGGNSIRYAVRTR